MNRSQNMNDPPFNLVFGERKNIVEWFLLNINLLQKWIVSQDIKLQLVPLVFSRNDKTLLNDIF